jgi:predicted nucleotidyltransferase
MRLTKKQLTAIKESFTELFLPDDHLWLFGSRTDDNARGGDIDLYIETTETDSAVVQRKRVLFGIAIQKKIGEQRLDVIINMINKPKELIIYQEARATGILLI